MTEGVRSSPTTGEKVLGWAPDHLNPNLQRYWDGSQWTATRRWISGRWVEGPTPAPQPATAPSGANPTHRDAAQAGQAPVIGPATSGRPASSVTVGIAGLLLCGVLLIVGSVTPWLTVSFGAVSASTSGTSIPISHVFVANGWFTLCGGVLLIVLASLISASGAPVLRTLSLLTALAAAASALYGLVRILQLISRASTPTFNAAVFNAIKANPRVGWGLIVAVVGGIGAVICAWSEGRTPKSR